MRLNKPPVILLLSAMFFLGSLCGFLHFLHSPLQHKTTEVIVVLKPGTSVKAMKRQLQAQGVLSRWQGSLFNAWIHFKGAEKKLRAGEYVVALNITPKALLKKFLKGEVVQYSVTLAEGITFHQALALISKHPAVKQTLTHASEMQIMALLGQPGFAAEGLFFPDTYYFPRDTSDLTLLLRARQTMEKRLYNAWEKRDRQIVLQSPYEALILASIIEKESALPAERFLISGVFQRRLAKKMRLQADPTVIYGVRDIFRGDLTRAHLRQDTPFNTYLHAGLPPTPIALPGRQAIEAALHPEPGEALYFVAKGDGSHYFSAELPVHDQAVVTYQIPKGLKKHE